jgi:hypothetical protein
MSPIRECASRHSMPYFLGLMLLAGFGYLVLTGLARADARNLASALRMLVPAALSILAIAFAFAGRPGMGALLAIPAILLFIRFRRRNFPDNARQSPLIRSPWLELQVGGGRSEMDGFVLAGEHEGRQLSTLDPAILLGLHQKMAEDAESRALMETYLDRRMPGWRGDAHAHVDGGQGRAPGAGAMADEEAYQILGLEPGASAADIRKAHRSLSQRMRIGTGPVLLQSRIDEARDVLLARHD